MANLKNVVYMSNENYNTLITTGSVTIGGVTYQYDSDNVYVTPDTSVSTEANQGLSATEKTNAKTNIDLNNVDNTSDLNKPISTAVQTALNGKQDTLTAGKNIAIQNNVISATEPQYELIEKIIVGYSMTTTQPDDWETNYTSYFTNNGTAIEPTYVAVTGTTAPTWEANKYYSYSADSISLITRNKYTDGNPYSLKGLFCTVGYNNTTYNSASVAMYVDFNNKIPSNVPSLGINKNSVQFYNGCPAYIRVDNINGCYGFSIANGSSNRPYTGNSSFVSSGTVNIAPNAKITTVNLNATLNGGSEVYIYGVKA